MDISIDLNILEVEPAAQYHAKADRYLSSHQLLDFIRCPWLHRKKSVGLIEDSDSASYLIGRAAHTRILEGRDAYEAAFALGGPINEKTGKPFGAGTKAFAEWVDYDGAKGTVAITFHPTGIRSLVDEMKRRETA